METNSMNISHLTYVLFSRMDCMTYMKIISQFDNCNFTYDESMITCEIIDGFIINDVKYNGYGFEYDYIFNRYKKWKLQQ